MKSLTFLFVCSILVVFLEAQSGNEVNGNIEAETNDTQVNGTENSGKDHFDCEEWRRQHHVEREGDHHHCEMGRHHHCEMGEHHHCKMGGHHGHGEKRFSAEEWYEKTKKECEKLTCPENKDCKLNKKGKPVCVGEPHEGSCFPTIPIWSSNDKVQKNGLDYVLCTFDDECEPNEKCCSMPHDTEKQRREFGHRSMEDVMFWAVDTTRKCIRTCPKVNIDYANDECQFGHEKDANGCPTEKCYDPCEGVECPTNYHCQYQDTIGYFKHQAYRFSRIQEHYFGFATMQLKPKKKMMDRKPRGDMKVLKPETQRFIKNYLKTLWLHQGDCLPDGRKELGSCPPPFPKRGHKRTIKEVCEGKTHCVADEHCPEGSRCCFDAYCELICMEIK
ncbi:hypothetical protein SNEBB_004401 [Seison nebaliae]|nr:hypothetical protein SNEBB_004401 [Seison nebaliae]